MTRRFLRMLLVGAAQAILAQAATVEFMTAGGASVNPGTGTIPVNANVVFTTLQDQLVIEVANLQVGSGTVAQTISAVDFLLSGSWKNPVLISYSGIAINLGSAQGSGSNRIAPYTVIPGGYESFTAAQNRWKIYTTSSTDPLKIAGGIELTTLSDGNPSQTIIGPENSPGYYKANKGLSNDNPFLQTPAGGHVTWVIQFAPNSGVTAQTTVTRARMSWNTAFSAGTQLELERAPEPSTVVLLVPALALGVIVRRRRATASASNDRSTDRTRV